MTGRITSTSGIGDGNPLEYGGTYPDGTRYYHPPWGPMQFRPQRRVRFVPVRRPWWRRLLKR